MARKSGLRSSRGLGTEYSERQSPSAPFGVHEVMRRGPVISAIALLLGLWTAEFAIAEETQRVVLVVRSPDAPAVIGLDELVEALRAILDEDVRVEVVNATPPSTGEAAAGDWGAAVARSEGGTAAIWLEPGAAPGGVRLYLVTLVGDQHRVASLEVSEPDPFDRGRTLALAVRPILEPPDVPPDGRESTGDTQPSTTTVGEEPLSDPSPERGVELLSIDEEPSRSVVALRVALGPVLRSDGPSPSARLALGLAFLGNGWVQLAGELVREEPLEPARERSYLSLGGGFEVEWRFLRGSLGAYVTLALIWLDGQQGPGVGTTLGGMFSVAAQLAPELYLELPFSLEGRLAAASSSSLPEVEGTLGLLLGFSPSGW
ncbi:MAG: hypothetical protein RIB77_29845 [Sandaracinaceae bacterium]